jgi:predicted tellurium resistance membrane protein TerC
MLEWITDPNSWLALGTLTILEIVLGIDNVIFLSLVVDKIPKHQQKVVRRFGLGGAVLMRLALLASIAWVIQLTEPLLYVLDHSFSARDLILLIGGIFLLWKSVLEIYETIRSKEQEDHSKKDSLQSFIGTIIQIMLLDIIFSLDSMITAVGLSDHLIIMMVAMLIAVGIIMMAAKPIGDLVSKYPSVKLLALAFLVLIGFILLLECFGFKVPKGYIYFAMFFSILVELLNLINRKNNNPSSKKREVLK